MLIAKFFHDMIICMNILTLSHATYSDIHAAFNSAFSDYQIPVNVTLQNMVIENIQRGMDYSSSFGAFTDEGELVGFIFCGVRINGRELTYYDGATGVIPSYRGQGIGGRLIKKAQEDAQSKGARAFILEVLQENSKAQKLYEAQGFTISRNLWCYQKQLKDIELEDTFDYEIYTPSIEEFFKIAQNLPLPYTPSWQNSFASVAAIFDHLTTRIVTVRGEAIGYFALAPSTGHLLQISAKENSHAIFKVLISIAKTYTKSTQLQCINIEENSPFITYLKEDLWDFLDGQYEMIKYF